MNEALRIYLRPDGELVRADDGRAVPVEAADLPADRPLAVAVPGEDVLVTDVDLPPVRQARRRIQAARYSLEDRLAAPVETVHLALGPRGEDGFYPAAVVGRERMEGWLEAFAEARPAVLSAMMPDYLCLPAPQPGEAVLWLAGGRAMCRRDAVHGFACEYDLVESLLTAPDVPERLRVVAESSPDADALLNRLEQADFELAPGPRVTAGEAVVNLLASMPARPPINLLQERYAPASPLNEWWRPFRATAALFVAWLGLALAAQAVHYWQLQQRLDDLQSRTETLFHEAFPDVRAVNDVRAQAEQEIRRLRAQQGGHGLFPLLTATARAAGSVPGLKMESLQYRDGELFLTLQGENVQSVERLRAGFAGIEGAALEIQNADAGAEGVNIRARVSRGDA